MWYYQNGGGFTPPSIRFLKEEIPVKKRVTALLATLLFLMALTGCAGSGKPADQTPATTTTTAPAAADPLMSDTANALGITSANYPRIDGSTSTLEIVRAIRRTMFAPADTLDEEIAAMTASKTVPSYQLLIDGDVDLIIVPYASQEVRDKAKTAGVELEFYKVAAEALIFITPKDNTATGITREQVRSVYLNNAIANWSQLGGPDRALVPLCRNADSGSQSQMDNLVLDNQPMHPDIVNNYVELTMEGMLEQVAFYHNGGLNGQPTDSYALGYTLYSYLQNVNEITGIGDQLKILDYEGVTPTADSVADGSYPLSDGYYAVTRGDLPVDHPARAVITWLQSDAGGQMIADRGLIPCKAG